MINGHFSTMMKIVHSYFDVVFNVCTLFQLLCALNYNGGGYNFIVEIIKHYHMHLNDLIVEHNVEINLLNNMYGHTNEFEFIRCQKRIQLWSYSRLYVPGVFSYNEN